MTDADPYRLVEHADYVELESRHIGVSVASRDLELFGLLLGERLTALGGGHAERDVGDDRLLTATAPEGWVAVLIAHGVAVGRVDRVTARVLASPTQEVDSASAMGGLVGLVRAVAKEAREQTPRSYFWASVLSPRGPDSNLVTRARLRLGGRYDWDDVVLEPLARPYVGEEPLGWGVFKPYTEYGIRVAGALNAPTVFIAQREADTAVRRISFFLSLIFRTSIEPRQQIASLVQGGLDDLSGPYGRPDVVTASGRYTSAAEAFAQRAADIPEIESDMTFSMPADAPTLWRAVRHLDGEAAQSLWNALGAYATAWKLKLDYPSLSLVSLVTAVEALIDGRTLTRCRECNNMRGIGTAYRDMIVRHTGVPEADLKKFTDLAYNRRSNVVHEGILFGGEGQSVVGFGPTWVPSASWKFVLQDWQALEELTAATLLTCLRQQVGAQVP